MRREIRERLRQVEQYVDTKFTRKRNKLFELHNGGLIRREGMTDEEYEQLKEDDEFCRGTGMGLWIEMGA